MECKKCGYENKEGAKFCQGCGEKINSTPAKTNNHRPQENYYQPMPKEKKSGKGLTIAIIVLSILTLAAIIAIVLILVLGGSGDKKESGSGSGSSSSLVVCSGSGNGYEGKIYLEISNNKVDSVEFEYIFNSSSDAKKAASSLDNKNIKYSMNGNKITITDVNSIKKIDSNYYVVGKSKSSAIETIEDEGEVTCR